MPVISITRLRLRSPRYLPGFLWRAFRSLRHAKRAHGCLAAETLDDANWTFWTRTAWNGEADLRAYMISGAHLRAMPKLKEWCDEAAIAHWEQESMALPDWREAHRRMIEVGRPSKVKHPAPAHIAFEIREPKL